MTKSKQKYEIESLTSTFEFEDGRKISVQMDSNDVFFHDCKNNQELIMSIGKCEWFDFINLLNEMTTRYENILTIVKE